MIRRLFRKFILNVRWRRRRVARVSRSLAPVLGVPEDVMRRIIDEANAELRALAAVSDAQDARPVLNNAMSKLQKYEGDSHSQIRDAAMVRFLDELPDREYLILSYRAQGLKPHHIASMMHTDVESVRRVLGKVYADMLLKTGGLEAGSRELRMVSEEETSA